jgi:selenocysteine-specific elongation factor
MTGGVPLRNFQLNRNLTNQEADRLFARASMVRIETETGALGFSRAHWSNLRSDALAVLTGWHEKWPSLIGMPMDRILEGSQHRLPRKTVTGIAAQLAREGVIVRTGRGARLPTHAPRLDVADQALWKMIEPLLVSGALRPPSLAQISASLRMQEKNIALVLGRVASCGLAVKVAPNRYYLHAALCELAEIVHALAEESPMGRVSTAAFRDRSGIGRNLSIEVLEFFDQMKFTRRLGEHRYLHGGGEFVFAQPL